MRGGYGVLRCLGKTFIMWLSVYERFYDVNYMGIKSSFISKLPSHFSDKVISFIDFSRSS